MEAILAKLVVFCSLLVDGVGSDVCWNLDRGASDCALFAAVNLTYSGVERGIKEGNVGRIGQLLMDSSDDS